MADYSKNYFSSAYFGRDFVLPCFFSVPIFVQIAYLYPEPSASVYYFVTEGGLFIMSISAFVYISAAIFLHLTLSRIFISLIQKYLHFLDYGYYYEKYDSEIRREFDHVMGAMSLESQNEDIRNNLNIILRLIEVKYPILYMMLFRAYSLRGALTSYFVMQLLLLFHAIFYCYKYGDPCGILISCLLLIPALIALLFYTETVAKYEMNAIRTFSFLIRHEAKQAKTK